jgi:hypothetical protein
LHTAKSQRPANLTCWLAFNDVVAAITYGGPAFRTKKSTTIAEGTRSKDRYVSKRNTHIVLMARLNF